MRMTIIAGLVLSAVCILTLTDPARGTDNSAKADARPTSDAKPVVQSGVYGFSGAKVPYGDPEGVIGECIWIFDADNKHQVAKGDCYENNPGTFRVVLKPGHYVVHGPGGNKAVEVKDGSWVKIESIVLLPLAP